MEDGGGSRSGYESTRGGHSRGSGRHSIDSHYRERGNDSDHRRGARETVGAGDPNDVKFPHHMHHINPEDDNSATRTLFLGNLYYEITEEEIRVHFERFGVIEDVDIKRPTKVG